MNLSQRGIAIALSATFIAALISPRPAKAQAAAPAGVQVCLSNPYCSAVVVVLGGLFYWQITRDGSTEYLPYTEDPEQLDQAQDDSWGDYIWASDDREAERKCQEYAQASGVVYIGRIRRGRNKYECRFRPYA